MTTVSAQQVDVITGTLEVVYQTRQTLFDHISKHREE